jgi:hypothetical protein
VAGLAGSQVGVVVVEVAYQRAVLEGGAVGGDPTAAYQGGKRVATELLNLLPDPAHGLPLEGAYRAPQRVQDRTLSSLIASCERPS